MLRHVEHVPSSYVSHWQSRVFQSDETERCRAIADAFPLATLAGVHPDGQLALAHAPVLLEGERAYVHLARVNRFSDILRAGSGFTCVFNGPDSFISARWYEVMSAPTWNFVRVHASVGRCDWIQDSVEASKILMRLIAHHEDRIGEGYFPKLSKEYLDRLYPEIVMVEMLDIEWWGLFKLNQNKTAGEHARVKSELDALGGRYKEVAELMHPADVLP